MNVAAMERGAPVASADRGRPRIRSHNFKPGTSTCPALPSRRADLTTCTAGRDRVHAVAGGSDMTAPRTSPEDRRGHGGRHAWALTPTSAAVRIPSEPVVGQAGPHIVTERPHPRVRGSGADRLHAVDAFTLVRRVVPTDLPERSVAGVTRGAGGSRNACPRGKAVSGVAQLDPVIAPRELLDRLRTGLAAFCPRVLTLARCVITLGGSSGGRLRWRLFDFFSESTGHKKDQCQSH